MGNTAYAMSFFYHLPAHLLGPAIILIVFLIVLSLRCRRDEPIAGQSPASGSSGESRNHWFLGLFYANPDDPTLFVKNRFGYGLTLNFGHWISWLMLTAPILIALAARFVGARH